MFVNEYSSFSGLILGVVLLNSQTVFQLILLFRLASQMRYGLKRSQPYIHKRLHDGYSCMQRLVKSFNIDFTYDPIETMNRHWLNDCQRKVEESKAFIFNLLQINNVSHISSKSYLN